MSISVRALLVGRCGQFLGVLWIHVVHELLRPITCGMVLAVHEFSPSFVTWVERITLESWFLRQDIIPLPGELNRPVSFAWFCPPFIHADAGPPPHSVVLHRTKLKRSCLLVITSIY
jgi:hypothetical protein